MCLHFVEDANPCKCCGEAFKLMRMGADDFLHTLYYGSDVKYAIGQLCRAKNDNIVIASDKNQDYFAGYHCWTELPVAAAMREVASGRHRRAIEEYVVVRVSYQSRLALGTDNPHSLDPDYQFQCVVLGEMVLKEIVKNLPKRDLPVVISPREYRYRATLRHSASNHFGWMYEA